MTPRPSQSDMLSDSRSDSRSFIDFNLTLSLTLIIGMVLVSFDQLSFNFHIIITMGRTDFRIFVLYLAVTTNTESDKPGVIR